MDTQTLIAKFNPANAANLTQADLQELRGLNDEQINELAKAYPNTAHMTAYLVLYDTLVKEDKQLYQLSTWQNLRNVRKFANKKNLRPHTFRQLMERKGTATRAAAATALHTRSRRVVDLSAAEAAAELKASIGQAGVTMPPPAGAVKRGPGGKFQKTITSTQDAGNVPEDQQFADDES